MYQNIGELQVPMQHVHVIKGLETIYYLAHEIASFLFRKLATDLTELVEVATITVLRKQIEIILSFLNIVQAYNVRGRNLAQNCNF
jgi:hypothetical protein